MTDPTSPPESPARPAPPTRQAFPFFHRIPTRWMDNDQYGHVNNVVYYAYFDTVISHFLIGRARLDVEGGPVIGVCAESGCTYRAAISHPAEIDAGLRVGRLGRSSATYHLGIFAEDSDLPAAYGHFTHVFVDRKTMRPVAIPDSVRAEMELVRNAR